MIWKNAGCCTGRSSRTSRPGRCTPSPHSGAASFPYWMPCALGAQTFWTGWTSSHRAVQKSQQENRDRLSCCSFHNCISGSNEKILFSNTSRETDAFFTFTTLLNCSGANRWNIVFMAKAWVTTRILVFSSIP